MLEEETCRRSVRHAPSHAARVNQGKNTISACVAYALGFRLPGAPPQVGGLTTRALEVGVSNKHPTTLLLFFVLPKILSKFAVFLGKFKT